MEWYIIPVGTGCVYIVPSHQSVIVSLHRVGESRLKGLVALLLVTVRSRSVGGHWVRMAAVLIYCQ